MKYLRTVTFASSLLLAQAMAYGQAFLPKSWKRLNGPPRSSSEVVRCAQQGGGAMWHVEFDGPRLNARPIKNFERARDAAPYELDWAHALDAQPVPPGGTADNANQWATRYARDRAGRIVVPLDDGWLIGFNAGEYGGSLWWYPPNEGQGRRLSDKNVAAILPTPASGTYLILSGLAHLGDDQGSAFWVDRDEQGEWRISSVIQLNGSPEAHAVGDQGIVLASRAAVDLLGWTGDLRTIQRSIVTSQPSSVAFGPAGTIALGRSVLVSLLRPLNGGVFRETWFLPEECQRFVYEHSICMCAGTR